MSWIDLLGTLSALVIIWGGSQWCFSPLRSFPGPFPASISRLWHIFQIVRGKQNVVLDELHDKHGPVIRIAPDEALAIPDYRFQTPMSTTEPKKKNEASRYFASGYTLSNLLQNEDAVDGTVALFLSYLDRFAESGEAFHLDRYITFAAFDVIGEMLFSKQFGFPKEDGDVGRSIENGKFLSVYASVAGFIRWIHVALLGNPFVTWLGILPMGHLYETTVRALDDRLVSGESRFDVVAHWVRALEKNHGKLTHRDVYAVAIGAVGAGSDTVSCALQSFVYHMNRHADAWHRVRKEIDEAMCKGMCLGQVVSFHDAQRLPFLQICIKEALRVFAPVPQGLPRVAPEGGLWIGDQHIPAGTIVSINAWVMQRNKDIWGTDAREFRPDRWLKEGAASLDRYFMPWGQGYNSCPGQHIARIELSKISATLARDYILTQVDPGQDWQWRACFTMVPHSWPCVVEKRRHGA